MKHILHSYISKTVKMVITFVIIISFVVNQFSMVSIANSPSSEITDNAAKYDISQSHIIRNNYWLHKQYTGQEITLDFSVQYFGIENGDIVRREGKLYKDVDYVIQYENNINVGEATLIITGIGEFYGTKTETFVIEKLDISDYDIEMNTRNYKYTGEEICPEISVSKTLGEGRKIELTKDVDYTVEYQDNIEKGTAKVVVDGIGNCEGGISKEYLISSFDILDYLYPWYADYKDNQAFLESLSHYNSSKKFLYTGEEVCPTFEEICPGLGMAFLGGQDVLQYVNLRVGVDYEIEYVDNINPGFAKAIIRGIGEYTGEIEATFEIIELQEEDYNISKWYDSIVYQNSDALYQRYTYSLDQNYPQIQIKIHDTTLVQNTDYEIEYGIVINDEERRIEKGYVTVRGIGRFCGSIQLQFWIEACDIHQFINEKNDEELKKREILGENYTGNPLYGELSEYVFLYDGQMKEPEIYLGELTEGIDYELVYENNISGRGARVLVTGINRFRGDFYREFEILPIELNEGYFTSRECESFGENGKPNVIIPNLIEGIDYEIRFEDFFDQKYIFVRGINENCHGEVRFNYSDDYPIDFIYVGKDISGRNITLSNPYDPWNQDNLAFYYDGSEIKPEVYIEGLWKGEDYTLEYRDNIEVGEAKIIVTGIGNYTGSVEVTFTIRRKNVSDYEFDYSFETGNIWDPYYHWGSPVYTGEEIIPRVRCWELSEGVDYEVECFNNVDAGDAYFVVTGLGDYEGEKRIDFTIYPRDIQELEVNIAIPDNFGEQYYNPDFEYNGEAICPDVYIDGLTLDVDYTVEYSDNVNTGNSGVTVKGIGNYTGEVYREFNILPKYIDSFEITLDTYEYSCDGTEKKPVVTIEGLQQEIDYSVSYWNNVNPGEAVAIVDGINNYSGRKEIGFRIYASQYDTTWQEEYTYTLSETDKKIILKQYNGTGGNVFVPAKACINGIEYKTEIYCDIYNTNTRFFPYDIITSFSTQSGVELRNVTGLFYELDNLKTVDLSNTDTTHLWQAHSMFHSCDSLESICFGNFNTSKLSSLYSMFWGCVNLKSVDLSLFDTSNVTEMHNMFYGCGIESIDLSSFDTSMTTNMSCMFKRCINLTELDISSFDTSNVTNMSSMFSGCKNLKEIDLSGINVDNVIYAGSMFSECTKLEKLNLASLNFSNAYGSRTMSEFVLFCPSLQEFTTPASIYSEFPISIPIDMFEKDENGILMGEKYTNLVSVPANTTIYSAYNLENGKATITLKGIYEYTGSVITPEFSVDYNGMNLVEGEDYTVYSYYNSYYDDAPISAGTKTIVINGINRFKGRITKNWQVLPKSVSADMFELTCYEYEYDGLNHKPDLKITSIASNMINSSQYRIISSSYYTNAGEYTVQVEGRGNFKGIIDLNWRINKSLPSHTASQKTVKYNGSLYNLFNLFSFVSGTGDVTFSICEGGTGQGSIDGNLLNITKAGTFVIKAETAESANYLPAEITSVLTVEKADGSGTIIADDMVYGEDFVAVVRSSTNGTNSVKYSFKPILSDDDSFSEAMPENVGKYIVKATFGETDLYNSCSARTDFYIKPASISQMKAVLSTYEFIYDGTEKKPNVVIDGLVKDRDYTVVYEQNIEVGTGIVSIWGCGNYSGSLYKLIKITEAPGVIDHSLHQVDSNTESKSETEISGITQQEEDNKEDKTSEVNTFGDDTIEEETIENRVEDKEENNVETVTMYRLYNSNSGEHFYTSSIGERDFLISAGWEDEGIGWLAPKISNTPVYRLYNKNSGEHHYTTMSGEKDFLISIGWEDEGIGWYSDDNKTTPLYRLYNPNAEGEQEAGAHHYTKDKEEEEILVTIGWNDENIGWYGL